MFCASSEHLTLPLPPPPTSGAKMSHHHGKRNLFSLGITQVALRGGTSLCMDNFRMSHFERKRSLAPVKRRLVGHCPFYVPLILPVALETNVGHWSSRRSEAVFAGESSSCLGKPNFSNKSKTTNPSTKLDQALKVRPDLIIAAVGFPSGPSA